MSRPLTQVGFYGKLPCRGDFLQRRVPQDFVDVWDVWLRSCMHEARECLQDTWLSSYLTGPIWRFVLGPGVCGSGTYAGVLAPSVDRVGRYFPLTVLAQLQAEDCPMSVACGNQSLFETAESLVLEALEAAALDFDTFDERVALLRERLDVAALDDSSRVLRQLTRATGFPMDFARWQLSLSTVEALQDAVNAFAYREASRGLQPLALWWTRGSNLLTSSWLCTRGLPDPRASVAMLTGDWSGTDWATVSPKGCI
jgi:type VI secretion system protein ImpM